MGFTVLLDPGHGGAFDGCASCNKKLLEKNLVLDISRHAGTILKSRNINVIYTRTRDKHFNSQLDKEAHFNPDAITDPEEKKAYQNYLAIDLAERAKAIKCSNPDIIISLHANSGSKTMRGLELFVPFEEHFNPDSYLLAGYLHHALIHVMEQHWLGTMGNLNIYDRGIRQAKFNVLRNMPCPAVLIEIDYITHPEVEKNFLTKNYKEKIARAIADAILLYAQERTCYEK